MGIKETIEHLYQTNTNYTNPEQAINQAESLKSLSTDLYTDAKRFIYELLQNADDSVVDGHNVDVNIKLFDDTLVIGHTGKIFTNRDVQGLCSINNGTKKSDTTKTGYKGIGFKSVFGQSNQVTIFTDNEYFKFDANYDFDWKEEWGADQEAWEDDNDREFLYPWQIIPIYLDDSNNDVNSEIQEYLINGNFNVATIIKVSKLGEIKKAIKELSLNVNMFLFLKNISSIQFETEETTLIEIERSEDELVLKKDTEVQVSWLVKTIELTVEDELKQILQADANIPKKLKETDNIELTLAIKKTENGLEKLSDNETLLYAYLPTDEKRYKLPILVNSTFLTSANRESLHTDSKWNQWLFQSISTELFKWIAELVQGEYLYQAYKLVPSKLNMYDDLSNAYNKGIDEAIETIPFILSKDNELLKVNEGILDKTKFSEKDFIGSDMIIKFMKNKLGDNNIVEKPFIPNVNIPNIKINTFTWNDVSALFAFDDFKAEHTVEKNIQLIEYFKNALDINELGIDKDTLKNIPFILDHKNNLNHSNNIYFPTPDDTTWNSPNSEISFLHEQIQLWLAEKQPIREWLERLGVVEKTDITFLVKTIIPNAETYVRDDNAFEVIQTIYNLYKKENIDRHLEELLNLKLLTTKGNLIPAVECYFSDTYNPQLKIETNIEDDIFISEDYLSLDSSINEVRRFFKFMGVSEEIKPLKIQDKNLNSILINTYGIQNGYFDEDDKTFKPFQSTFRAKSYKNIITLPFISKINNFSFSKYFWNYIIENIRPSSLIERSRAYWGYDGREGQISGNLVDNYIPWYIKNNSCLPTTKKNCENSENIFLNTDDIKKIAGEYLPVFDGAELSPDWKSFFNFKSELKLEDYLELLTNIISDKNNENKIKHDNKKRVQLIYKALLEQSTNWGTDEIEKVKLWAITAFLTDEDDNLLMCNELKYYADGDNSIFQNIHPFIDLNQENKSHQNIETFLGYLGVEILRQDSFNIDFEGEETESDLKYQLECIFPYLEKWIQKLDTAFDIVALNKKLNTLQINEASKLLLVYDEIPLKAVQVHLKEDVLLLTTPWSSNTSMLELPKVLCRYLDIKGYEDKLAFLLKADDESEINEYFENEGIDLPINDIKNVGEEIVSEEERTSLGVSKKEYNDINKISSSFSHISESSIEKKRYIVSLLKRSKKRILEHLNNLDEYNCDNVDNSALTVLSGITKNGNDIYIIPRPSDNGKVIIYHDSEFDTLEYSDSELWYEDGVSIPKKLTFGKVLREAKINKIPITRSKEEKIIDIIHNIAGEDTAYEPILPSSFDIAKTMASLANTNGGYFIVGCSKESDILGINAEFNLGERIQESIKYSKYFEELEFQQMDISGKTIIIVKIDKANETIHIEGRKYIRYGSIIIEELADNNKPLIITEGKTDWKHIKKALERFKNNGLYTDLDIQFLEYEDMNMGDGELDRMVQTYCKTEQPKKHIFIFDRDNSKFVNKYGNEKFNNHENNVYSFCIPKICDELDQICIEFYYKEADLTTEDEDGKRIFIGKEFNPRNGISKCGKYVTAKRNAKDLDILDRDKEVYLKEDNDWNNNIALSKNDFTNNIINDLEGFDNFDIEYFKLIFDVIESIVND